MKKELENKKEQDKKKKNKKVDKPQNTKTNKSSKNVKPNNSKTSKNTEDAKTKNNKQVSKPQDNKESSSKDSKKEVNKTSKTKENIVKEDIIGETIKERKKLPKELKDEISNSIFCNILIIIFMMIATLIINLMFNRYNLSKFENIMKIAQITVCLITIAILEYSYKKDSVKKALYGVEFLIFSIAILYVPYMYDLNNIDFLKNVICVFAIYYIVKSIFTFIYYRHKYLKENISDVKEIVKEDKKGYLDEESTKTLKEQKKKK